jgi:hypothetical protein
MTTIRLYGREWTGLEKSELLYRDAKVNLEAQLASVTPTGPLFNLSDPTSVKMFECVFVAEYYDYAEQVNWLADRGLDIVLDYLGRGVTIGVANPFGANGNVPMQFRASGKTLRDALLDYAGRM